MKTQQDLKLEYRQETGLEPIITAYGFRPYLAWLEEKTLKLMNKDVEAEFSKQIDNRYFTELPSER